LTERRAAGGVLLASGVALGAATASVAVASAAAAVEVGVQAAGLVPSALAGVAQAVGALASPLLARFPSVEGAVVPSTGGIVLSGVGEEVPVEVALGAALSVVVGEAAAGAGVAAASAPPAGVTGVTVGVP
jgi:hypothetical protein